jgi:hypothetical protein
VFRSENREGAFEEKPERVILREKRKGLNGEGNFEKFMKFFEKT